MLASLLPQTTLPQASPAAQLELDTRARRLRARGVAGNAILDAFRCHSPPSHPTLTPDNLLQTAPFLIARYDDARAKPTHARALRRRRRSLARSIARAVCGGSDGVRLHRPSRALRAPRVTRTYSFVISVRLVSHHRFRLPRARPARVRGVGGGARSLLDFVRAVWRCGRWRWRWRWRSGTTRVTRITRASHARILSSSMCVARVITVFRSPPTHDRHARVAAAAALALTFDRAHAVWRWRWRWRWRSVTTRVT